MKEIPLTQGKVALVDDQDFEKVSQFKWYAHKNYGNGRWYAQRHVRTSGKESVLLMHRFIMGLEYGDKLQVDHRDRVNTLDNRRKNLRKATANQNCRNIGVPKHNTSGFKGVDWHKQAEKWRARIMLNNRDTYLGHFPTCELAAIAYDEAALKYHGEFAVTNASLGLLKKPVASATLAQAA